MTNKVYKKVFFKNLFKSYVMHIFETVTMCLNKPHLLNNNSKFLNSFFNFTAQNMSRGATKYL